MAEIAISLAISAAVSAASAGLEYALTPKPKKPDPVDRGKLDDVRFSIPAYGASIFKTWGTGRTAPIWFWHTPAIDRPVTTPGQSGGKGGGGGTPPTPDVTEHRYFKNMAGVFHDGQIQHVSRIWFDNELVLNAPISTNFATTSSTRYEAEHGVLAGGANVITEAEASEGRKVTGIGSGGSVTINCDVPTTGAYEIAIGYTTPADRTFKVSVNGGATTDVDCLDSGGAGLIAVQTITRTLTAGANTIAFSNAGAAAPDLDYISIAPALVFTETPSGLQDRRSFTGITTPGRVHRFDPDIAWPINDDLPVFTDPTGGLAGDNQQTVTLGKWGNPQIRIYLGSETQNPDPLIEQIKGVGNTSAYRGYAYIVIEGVQLLNGRPPNVTIEFVEGTRSAGAIVTSLAEMVGLSPANDLDVTALSGQIIGDNSGFSGGNYTAINWTGINNATQTGNGAITKTSGGDNSWTAYARQGTTVGAGTDASIRFTAGAAGTYMIGFATTDTPSGSLPQPYASVPFAVLLNKNANPSQASHNSIQMSLGGGTNTTDIGTWSPGDEFQVEIRNGRFAVYQNSLMLGGFVPPPATFPLRPVWAGYALGGGPTAASYATGADIGSEPVVRDAGALILHTQREAQELLVELMTRFQFITPEVDGKIKVVRLNASSELTLTEAECQAYRGDGLPPNIEISRKNPLLFPKYTIVNYSDPQLDMHNNSQTETRLFGPQKGTVNISLAMVETAVNMRKLAAVISDRTEVEGQTYKFALGPKYKHVHQGTVLTVMEGSSTHKIRVTELLPDLPAGLIDVEAVRQSAVFDPNVAVVDLGVDVPIVPVPGHTKGVFIDAPLVEPESAGDEVRPIQYVAVTGRGSGNWPGAFIMQEFPLNSGNYVPLTNINERASIGVTTGTLPTWSDPDTKDTTSSLTIDFYHDPQLASVSEADLLANPKLNLLAVKNSTGAWEYVKAQTVSSGTPTAPYTARYTISNLFRGRYETIDEAGTHTSADEVIVMNSAVKALVMATALLSVSCNYRFLTIGQNPDQVDPITNIWLGRSMLPHKPTDLNATKDSSGDWLVSAIGHPRLAEQPESYVARIRRNSDGVLMRDIPITPGARMAAILNHIIHADGGGTWSTSTYADISKNNTTGDLDPTACYVTQPIANGTEINTRVTVPPAPAPFLTGIVRLNFGPSDFTDPFGAMIGAILTTKNDNDTTLTHINVFDWSTNQYTFFDLPTVNGVVYVRVVWSGTEIRWQFSGDPINPAMKPQAILKDLPVPSSPSTHLRIGLQNAGPTGSGVVKVENITIGGLSTPQTIYSLAQQQNDNSGSGIAVGNLHVEFWQVAPFAPNQKGLSVKGVF